MIQPIIVIMVETAHRRRATPGGPTVAFRVPEQSSIAGEEQRWAAAVVEPMAPRHRDLSLVKDLTTFGPFPSKSGYMFVINGTRLPGAPVVLMADLVPLAVEIWELSNGEGSSCANSRRPNTHKSVTGEPEKVSNAYSTTLELDVVSLSVHAECFLSDFVYVLHFLKLLKRCYVLTYLQSYLSAYVSFISVMVEVYVWFHRCRNYFIVTLTYE